MHVPMSRKPIHHRGAGWLLLSTLPVVPALAEARRTLPSFQQIRRIQRQAEYGKWRHWYRGEWQLGIRHTRKLAADFIRYLHDPTMTLPPPFLDNGWQSYSHIMKFEGNRTVDVRWGRPGLMSQPPLRRGRAFAHPSTIICGSGPLTGEAPLPETRPAQ